MVLLRLYHADTKIAAIILLITLFFSIHAYYIHFYILDPEFYLSIYIYFTFYKDLEDIQE